MTAPQGEPQVGDLVFAHTQGVMGRAIRLGERLKFRKGAFFNHVGIVDHFEDGVAILLQAEPHGVTCSKPVNPAWTCIFIEPPDSVDIDKMLAFARTQVGSKYGWGSILSILVDTVTWDWFPAFRARGTWICSALAAESLRFGGWFHDFPDIYIPKPSDLWDALVYKDDMPN